MEKLIAEEVVESILANDKESFMAAFNAALAAKVNDALEVKKVEVASSWITPKVTVEEETVVQEMKEKDDEEEEDEEDKDEDEDKKEMKEEAEQIDELDAATYRSAGEMRHQQAQQAFGLDTPAADKAGRKLRDRSNRLIGAAKKKEQEDFANSLSPATRRTLAMGEEAEQVGEAQTQPPLHSVINIKTGKHVGTHSYDGGFKPAPGSNLKPHPTTIPDGHRIDKKVNYRNLKVK